MSLDIVQAHLDSLLKQSGHYTTTSNDREIIDNEGLSSYVFKKLSSKKFRKLKMSTECIEHTQSAIKHQIASNQPLAFVFPQGGYKLWRLPTTPNVDWAEFFNIAYIIAYLSPIASCYKPGVILKYYHFDRLMELHDNLTPSEIKSYKTSFTSLLHEFNTYLPKNFQLQLTTENDLYPGDVYTDVIESDFKRAEAEFDAFDKKRQEAWVKSAILNIKLNGREDWSKLNQKDFEDKIRKACIYENAATYCLTKVWSEVITKNTILIFVKPIAFGIAIGSTRTSTAKHWVGYGVLEKDAHGFYERILTPSQLQNTTNIPHTRQLVNIVPGNNFTSIDIYPRLNFSK